MFPQITSNEASLNHLHDVSIKIDNQAVEPKILPRILLLSQHKHDFQGLVLPTETDEEAERRENAKSIRAQLQSLKSEKGNELFLNWLERN